MLTCCAPSPDPPPDNASIAKFTSDRSIFDEIQKRECPLAGAVATEPAWRTSRAGIDERAWLDSRLKVIGGDALQFNAGSGECVLLIPIFRGDRRQIRFRYGPPLSEGEPGVVETRRSLGDNWWLEHVSYR